ncbi:MAG: hypothetical protein AAF602_32160, partial [Myxococcota bacterium]
QAQPALAAQARYALGEPPRTWREAVVQRTLTCFHRYEVRPGPGGMQLDGAWTDGWRFAPRADVPWPTDPVPDSVVACLSSAAPPAPPDGTRVRINAIDGEDPWR